MTTSCRVKLNLFIIMRYNWKKNYERKKIEVWNTVRFNSSPELVFTHGRLICCNVFVSINTRAECYSVCKLWNVSLKCVIEMCHWNVSLKVQSLMCKCLKNPSGPQGLSKTKYTTQRQNIQPKGKIYNPKAKYTTQRQTIPPKGKIYKPKTKYTA